MPARHLPRWCNWPERMRPPSSRRASSAAKNVEPGASSSYGLCRLSQNTESCFLYPLLPMNNLSYSRSHSSLSLIVCVYGSLSYVCMCVCVCACGYVRARAHMRHQVNSLSPASLPLALLPSGAGVRCASLHASFLFSSHHPWRDRRMLLSTQPLFGRPQSPSPNKCLDLRLWGNIMADLKQPCKASLPASPATPYYCE
jgi:hypothetical protein